MDVDLNMKVLSFIALLAFMTSPHAEPLVIFGAQLKINDKCQIEVTHSNGRSELVPLSLPEAPNCKFIKHAETNLIHIEQVANSYILLIESASNQNDQCVSNYTAIAVKNDGSVFPAGITKTSGTCHIDRERKVFEYFAHKIGLLN